MSAKRAQTPLIGEPVDAGCFRRCRIDWLPPRGRHVVTSILVG